MKKIIKFILLITLTFLSSLGSVFGEEKINGTISYGALEKASGGTLLIDEISDIRAEVVAPGPAPSPCITV